MKLTRYVLSRPSALLWWICIKLGDGCYWLAAWAAVWTWNIRGRA